MKKIRFHVPQFSSAVFLYPQIFNFFPLSLIFLSIILFIRLSIILSIRLCIIGFIVYFVVCMMWFIVEVIKQVIVTLIHLSFILPLILSAIQLVPSSSTYYSIFHLSSTQSIFNPTRLSIHQNLRQYQTHLLFFPLSSHFFIIHYFEC